MTELNYIKEKLIKNETEFVIKELQSHYLLGNEFNRTLDLINSKRNKIKSDFNNGFISFETYNTELTRIHDALLDIIQELENKENRQRKIKEEKTIKFSIVGFIDVGKTVFLTVLFNELLNKKIDSFIVEPSNDKTLRKVLQNINILKRGELLNGTHPRPIELIDRYNLSIINKQRGINEAFELEVLDFSGEQYKDMENPRWIHENRNDFQHVVDSDLIFVAIELYNFFAHDFGLEDFYSGIKENEIVDNLIAVIQNIRNSRKQAEEKDFPISILILKSDLLIKHNIKRETVVNKIKRLVDYCQSRFSNVSIYFTSSYGMGYSDNSIPTFETVNVTEPLIWGLKRMNKE